MTKYLILATLLFAMPTYGLSNTTVPKRNILKPEHSKHVKAKHDRVHAKFTRDRKVHITHVKISGGTKHAKSDKPILTYNSHLSDEQIVNIMNSYKVSKSKQAVILRSINAASIKHNVNKALIVAIIARESSFKQYAVSRVGAQGLLQIMPEHHVKDPFHIPTNVDKGVEILADYIDEAGNINKGLSKYGNSDKYIGEVNATLRSLSKLV